MATTDDENTTDRHDEPDTTQFGDDPHHLNNTAFTEAQCHTCGCYVAKARHYTGPCYCSNCGRTQAGVIPYQPPPTPHVKPETEKPQTQEWQWGCLTCLHTGPATNPHHALQQLTTHEQHHHTPEPTCTTPTTTTPPPPTSTTTTKPSPP